MFFFFFPLLFVGYVCVAAGYGEIKLIKYKTYFCNFYVFHTLSYYAMLFKQKINYLHKHSLHGCLLDLATIIYTNPLCCKCEQKQVWIIYYRQIRNWRTLLHRRWADAAYAFTRSQNFSVWNDVIAAILKSWPKIRNPTPSINAYLLEDQPCQISSRSDLKQRSLDFFEEVAPTIRTRTTTRWVAVYEISSVAKNAHTVLTVIFQVNLG